MRPFRNRKKTLLLLSGALVGLACLSALWTAVRPTRIAFVNFRDWQVAEYLDAAENPFIRIHRLDIRDGSAPDFADHDVTVFFGMGLRLTEEQQAAVQEATRKGAAFYVHASSSQDSDLTSLRGETLQKVRNYLSFGGRDNLHQFLNYCRREIHGRTLFSSVPADPVEALSDYYFDPDIDERFETLAAYDSAATASGRFLPERPRVLILTSNISPDNESTARPFLALMKSLEAREINAYAAAGFGRRLEMIDEVVPNVVLLFAHGRLVPGQADSALALLDGHNVPLFTPLIVHEPIAQWEERQQGMQGGMLGQSIVMPEIDGGVNPFVIGGLAPNEEGYQVFTPIEARVERMADMIEGYIRLQKKPAREKKVAIVYLKGPGKNALVAEGLEVVPSLLNTLKHLRSEGYETGDLPETPERLGSLIDSLGPVLGSYAKGAQARFVERHGVTRIYVDTLTAWVDRGLRPELADSVKATYGPAPGRYLAGHDSLQGYYLALPAIHFGNVLILPQLLPALGDDAFKLVHGVKMPPPWPYLATYLYARYGFEADALIHFGTHGSLEFTPFKQSALSSLDWADALTGELPHFYLYTINNIGEAIIAKRRAYADLVSYVTPPFRQGDLYGPIREVDRLVREAEDAQDPVVHAAAMELVRQKVVEAGLDKDLDLPELHTPPISDNDFEAIHRYLHMVEAEKITEGLYTIGVPFTPKQVQNTIAQMFSDPLAWSRAEIAVLEGRATREELRQPHIFERRFRIQAFRDIAALSAGRTVQMVSPSVQARYAELKERHGEAGPDDVMEVRMSMASAGEERPKNPTTLSQDSLLESLSAISADAELRAWFLRLEDQEEFEKTAAMLDSLTLSKVGKLARAVPAMDQGLEQFEKPLVRPVIAHMAAEHDNTAVFQLLKSDSVLAMARARQAQLQTEAVNRFSKARNTDALLAGMAPNGFEQEVETLQDHEVREWHTLFSHALNVPNGFWTDSRLPEPMRAGMNRKGGSERLASNLHLLTSRVEEINEWEEKYIEAVETIAETGDAIERAMDGLARSGAHELDGLTNALDGGFISPSSGGDAVHNPTAVPTGRNLFGIDAESTPGEAAWANGIQLADAMLEKLREKNGTWPRKVAFTLWGGEFIRDGGTTVAQILYLLGAEPVRNSVGRVYDVRLVPEEEMNRPRIDVLVQTSGQFRDIGATRLYLIDKAVKLAAEAKAVEHENNVARSTLDAERVLKEKGLSPLEARELSTARVFGGVNGNYGTGIMGLVESGDRYESDTTIANQYLENMGAVYTEDRWGEYTPGLLEAAVQNIDALMHSRTSNVSGPLSLDHVYEFMGGLNTVIKKVTGRDPDGLFLDMRNPYNARAVDAKEAIWMEARSTVLNPAYLEPLTRGGASSAETLAETTRNTFAWNATKESVIDEELWDRYFETLVRDTLKLGLRDFFETRNPYALQEITAVMLETVRKGMWSPDESVTRELAEIHVDLVNRHDAGCSGFVCNNPKLAAMISEAVTPEQADAYSRRIEAVRSAGDQAQEAVVLERETLTRTLMDMARKNAIALSVLGVMVAVFTASYVRTRMIHGHDEDQGDSA